MLATLLGGLLLASSAAFAAAPADDTPGLPTSTVKEISADTAQYCVTGYAPNGEVTVRNERNDKTVSIRTNHKGSGCTDVPVELSCGEVLQETVVAAGVAADGNPGTSRAVAKVPGNVGKCAGSTLRPAGRHGSGSSSLSAVEITLIVVGAAALGGIGTGAVVFSRRRKAGSDD